MITQAIIDAIIDLAIPVTNAYQDVIGELELDVLTQPNMTHVTGLYIIMSEITSMRNFVLPIVNLINSLRDHKTNTVGEVGSSKANRAVSSVKISPTAQTYFGDVEDHCVLITQSLDQMRRSADGMIDLIFSTISAFQNESMKQLTTVTIIFLPMTFIIGYFGMNFDDFASIHNNERFFWSIALPVAIGTTIIMMREMIYRWFVTTLRRRGISRNRRRRLRKEAELKRNL
jgi:Mg2+ and Co2+ transporter CorA